jgi:hypothetical protein
MTATKTASTHYGSGYTLAANTNLYVTASGGVGSPGVDAQFTAAITNGGRIEGGPKSIGVLLGAGGRSRRRFLRRRPDGHGGTMVVDPKSRAASAPPRQFV